MYLIWAIFEHSKQLIEVSYCARFLLLFFFICVTKSHYFNNKNKLLTCFCFFLLMIIIILFWRPQMIFFLILKAPGSKNVHEFIAKHIQEKETRNEKKYNDTVWWLLRVFEGHLRCTAYQINFKILLSESYLIYALIEDKRRAWALIAFPTCLNYWFIIQMCLFDFLFPIHTTVLFFFLRWSHRINS